MAADDMTHFVGDDCPGGHREDCNHRGWWWDHVHDRAVCMACGEVTKLAAIFATEVDP
jgi:hypothetical protein